MKPPRELEAIGNLPIEIPHDDSEARAEGAKVPKNVPNSIPEKANTVVTNDPAQRPPR